MTLRSHCALVRSDPVGLWQNMGASVRCFFQEALKQSINASNLTPLVSGSKQGTIIYFKTGARKNRRMIVPSGDH